MCRGSIRYVTGRHIENTNPWFTGRAVILRTREIIDLYCSQREQFLMAALAFFRLITYMCTAANEKLFAEGAPANPKLLRVR